MTSNVFAQRHQFSFWRAPITAGCLLTEALFGEVSYSDSMLAQNSADGTTANDSKVQQVVPVLRQLRP